LEAEVKTLESEFFEDLIKAYSNGDRRPDKDVTFLFTKEADGSIKKHIVYKEGLFVRRDDKVVVRPDGTIETIQLEGSLEDVAEQRDHYIEKAIENENLAVGKDENDDPITIDSEEDPYLNIFEKAMWVVEVTKTFLEEVTIAEKRWNPALEQNDWPWDVPAAAAGPGNAVIDEGKSIPQMVAFGLSMFDEEERQQIVDALSNISWGTIKDMIKEKAGRYTSDNPDIVTYEATYDGATITMIILTGGGELIKKIANIKDNIIDLGKVNWIEIDLPYDKAQKLGADLANNRQLNDALVENVDLFKAWNLIDDDLAETGELIRKNSDALKQIDDAIKEGLDGADAAQDAVQTLGKTKPTWQEIQALFKRGNDFNRKVRNQVPNPYLYYEVTVEKTLSNGTVKRYRLDSYNPGSDIVSRKATNFDNIQTSTFQNYIDELKSKYQVGLKVVKPGQPIDGQSLQGSYKLEVPKSNLNSSKLTEFQQIANDNGVELIFTDEF
jgi:hypothetical protein